MVAVFFACCESFEFDGCVYCYDPRAFVDTTVLPISADIAGIGYVPRALSARILNQRGAFTVHGPPTQRITPEAHPFFKDTTTLIRLDIPASLKWDLLIHLDDYGVNRATLFPDLDGLCAHVNFETQEILRTHKDYGRGDNS